MGGSAQVPQPSHEGVAHVDSLQWALMSRSQKVDAQPMSKSQCAPFSACNRIGSWTQWESSQTREPVQIISQSSPTSVPMGEQMPWRQSP